MDALQSLGAATAVFVGGHFLLSHPLRQPLVGRMGAGPFLGLYSAFALLSFGWMVVAALAVPDAPPLWSAPGWAWGLAAFVMLLASILLAGSFVANPALPNATARMRAPSVARGVYAVTRHPMMWSFLLWAAVHAAIWPTSANLIVSAGFVILAFFGSLAQDRKKERLVGEPWREWEARTAFWPFGAQLSGRSGWQAVVPRPIILLAGLALWLAATAAHGWLGAPVVGPWHWFG